MRFESDLLYCHIAECAIIIIRVMMMTIIMVMMIMINNNSSKKLNNNITFNYHLYYCLCYQQPRQWTVWRCV